MTLTINDFEERIDNVSPSSAGFSLKNGRATMRPPAPDCRPRRTIAERTAGHVVYAKDRSLVHSGPYAVYGNRGLSYSPDPTIPKDEPGPPIAHR